jgi:hypothetical protein
VFAIHKETKKGARRRIVMIVFEVDHELQATFTALGVHHISVVAKHSRPGGVAYRPGAGQVVQEKSGAASLGRSVIPRR